MDYTQIRNIVSWKHMDVNEQHPTGISKGLEGELYIVQTTQGNRYYMNLLKNRGVHLFPYDESYRKLKLLQVDWITWAELDLEDRKEIEEECVKRNWTIFKNKCRNTRRLEILFK